MRAYFARSIIFEPAERDGIEKIRISECKANLNNDVEIVFIFTVSCIMKKWLKA